MKSSRIFLIGTLAFTALIIFSVALQQYAQRSRAASSEADILFTPLDGGAFAIDVEAKKDDKISAIDLHVTAENGTVSSWDECISAENEELPFTELINTPGATARYSCAVIKDKDQLPRQIVLSGKVACKDPNKPVRLTISTKSSVAGPVEGAVFTNKIGPFIDVKCDGSEPEPDEDVITTMDPNTCDKEIGGFCPFGIIETAQKGKKLSAVYMKLSYDADILKFNSIAGGDGLTPEPLTADVRGLFTGKILAQAGGTPPPSALTATPAPTSVLTTTPMTTPTTTPTASPSPTLSPTTMPTLSPMPPKSACRFYVARDDDAGIIELVYMCPVPTADLLSKMHQAVDFKAIAEGKGELKMESVQAIGPASAGNQPVPYTVKKSSATYTIGKANTQGNLKVDLKVRLQCVVKKPKGAQKLNIRVGLGDGKLKKPIFETGEFTVDEKGFWNGSVAFKAPAGSQYKLLVKGDKHMQKKICEATPHEDFPGAYSCDKGKITLKDGSNAIDLSNVIMLTGDLPPGEQDGISNAKDQSLVRNLIGKSDEGSAKLADINYDGVVNAVDHSCMIAALSVRWDEE